MVWCIVYTNYILRISQPLPGKVAEVDESEEEEEESSQPQQWRTAQVYVTPNLIRT